MFPIFIAQYIYLNVSIFLNVNKTSKLKPFNPKYRTLRLKKFNLYSALVSSSCIYFFLLTLSFPPTTFLLSFLRLDP